MRLSKTVEYWKYLIVWGKNWISYYKQWIENGKARCQVFIQIQQTRTKRSACKKAIILKNVVGLLSAPSTTYRTVPPVLPPASSLTSTGVTSALILKSLKRQRSPASRLCKRSLSYSGLDTSPGWGTIVCSGSYCSAGSSLVLVKRRNQRSDSRTVWKILWCPLHRSTKLGTVTFGVSPSFMWSSPLKISSGPLARRIVLNLSLWEIVWSFSTRFKTILSIDCRFFTCATVGSRFFWYF